MKEKSVEMRLLICLLVLAYWEQIIAPQVEPCQVEGTTRLFTAATHPQLCHSVEENLQWSYFCGNFRMREGKIFCKSLGYPSYQSDGGVSSNTIGGQAKITNLDCKGNETKLTDCSFTETTNECMVAIGLVCVSCSSNSVCGQNGQCTQNGTCVCREACENGGYCFAGRCICPEGFGGPICNECDPPCQNGGVCSSDGQCQCINPFDGPECELNSTTPAITNTTTMTTLQTTTAVNSTSTAVSNEVTLVIVVIALSLTVSCTIITICLGVLVFLAFLVTRMKPELNKTMPEQKEMPVLPESNHAIQSPDHDYCYIQDNQVSQSSFRSSPKKQGYYEIIETFSEADKNPNIQNAKTNSSSNQPDTDQGLYVIDDVNELYT